MQAAYREGRGRICPKLSVFHFSLFYIQMMIRTFNQSLTDKKCPHYITQCLRVILSACLSLLFPFCAPGIIFRCNLFILFVFYSYKHTDNMKFACIYLYKYICMYNEKTFIFLTALMQWCVKAPKDRRFTGSFPLHPIPFI